MIMPPRNAPQAVTCLHRVASRQRDTTAGTTAAPISRPPDPAPDDGASNRNVGRRPMNAAHLRRRLTYCVDRLAIGSRDRLRREDDFPSSIFVAVRGGGAAAIFRDSGFVLGTLIRGTLGLGGLALRFDIIGLGEPRTVFGLCGRLWRGGWPLLLLDLDLLGGFSSRFCGSCDSPSALKFLGAIDDRGQRKRHQDCDEHDARHYPRTPTRNKFFLCGPMNLATFHHIALQLAIKLGTPSGAAPCLSRRLVREPCSHKSLTRHMRLLWRVGGAPPS
jgi:hypothetical protein